jgi:hypothetical protein
MWPPMLAAHKLVLLLRPPGWPLVPRERRARLRLLAIAALAAQAIFVAAWIVAGELQAGYSATHQTPGELGDAAARHPWIMRAAFLVWGAGFVALGAAVTITLRGRPWSRVGPALFVAAGIAAASLGPLWLDCGATVDPACESRLEAGLLSWHTYAHHWIGLAFQLLLLATPFALARAMWPYLIGRLTLLNGVVGLAVFAAAFVGFAQDDAPYGVVSRLGLGVIHLWVILVAVPLLVEASGRWPSRSLQEGPFASFFRLRRGAA